MKEIEQVLGFLVEIEKLKTVLRKSRPVGLERYENSAEHSWHICLAALVLRGYANEEVDIDRVIRMLLVHDLGEIDAGDTIVYEAATPEVYERELAGIKRVLSLLPSDSAVEYLALWLEFEAAETPESKYARAIDRVTPLLQNLHCGGRGWRENAISSDKIFAVNRRIAQGSEQLWQVLEQKLIAAFDTGLLGQTQSSPAETKA